MIKKIFFTSLIYTCIFNILILNEKPVLSQSAKCSNAIQYVENDIEYRLNGSVREINILETYPTNPINSESKEVGFILPISGSIIDVHGNQINLLSASGGENTLEKHLASNRNIISSEQLTKSYAQRIINDCNGTISRVYFTPFLPISLTQAWSAHQTPRGIQLLKDECIPMNRLLSLVNVWGYMTCFDTK